MATLQNIKRRIKSVKNTQQITKAMKMVAAAKLRRAQENVIAARPYSEKIDELMHTVARKVPANAHPLLVAREPRRVALIVLSSDRGLCGGFNGNIIRRAERFIQDHTDLESLKLYIIGNKALGHFERGQVSVETGKPFGGASPDYADVRALAEEIIKGYIEEKTDEVYIAFARFRSALSQEPVVEKLLPIAPPGKVEEVEEECIFEPSKPVILEQLIPKYIVSHLFIAFLESAASEHGARMTAMDSASKNATEMIDALTLQFNRVRQAAITKELMEIIGGADALQG